MEPSDHRTLVTWNALDQTDESRASSLARLEGILAIGV
jgi:hypothetical protein